MRAWVGEGAMEWFVARDGETCGPFSFERLVDGIKGGELREDDLVWSRGMSDWVPARQIPGLGRPPTLPDRASAPPKIATRVDVPAVAEELRLKPGPDRATIVAQAVSPERAGAWRRFFARWIDVQISAVATIFGVAVALGFTTPEFGIWVQNPTNGTLFALLMMPLAFVLDSIVVGVFGNSLGKAVLGLRVRRTSGEPLQFGEYTGRNLKVWAYGFGICIPLFTLLAMLHQAKFLKNDGTTGYDVGKYKVEGGKLAPWQSVAAGVLAFALLAGSVYLRVIEQEDRRAFESGHKWTNPVTFAEVQVPPGWTSSSQTNDQGQSIYVFTYPYENLIVVFGKEDVPPGTTLMAYTQAFARAVNAMALDTPGTLSSVGGRNSWATTGYMSNDASQQVSVTVVQRGTQMWRTVAVRLKSATPDTESYRALRARLFASI